MRRLLAAILAVPVILATYLSASRRPHVAIALAVPVLLVGVSVARMQLAQPAAAGVAGVVATPFPDAAFEPVALGAGAAPAQERAPAAAVSAAAARSTLPAADLPDRGVGAARPGLAAIARPAATRPSVVRFRPLAGKSGVDAASDVSVRFTEAMDEAVTARTFRLTVNGKAVPGRLHWAEGSTVLVIDPAKHFPAGATVVASVTGRAKSAAGERIVRGASARFTVAKPAPKASSTGRTTRIPRVVAPGLYGVELYVLELMNCTRTGGWVRSNGTCRGAGTRNVAPLKLDAGISDTVARPYAYLLASRRLCHHFYDGDPGSRLRRAGYTNWDWAENVGGCGSNAPYASVLSTHLYFQSEKSYNGGHYRNMMNRVYDRVGIGVVKVNGVFRMVVNFYHP